MQGYASLIVVICFFFGVVLFSLGILAEYLAVSLTTGMGRPLYVTVARPQRHTRPRRDGPSCGWWAEAGSRLASRAVGAPRDPRRRPLGPGWPTLFLGRARRLAGEIGEAARTFGDAVRQRGGPWMAFWCAAAGGVGAAPDALRRETDTLRQLLGSLGTALGRLPERASGTLLFSSSAGGVYGDNLALPLTEHSRCRPISPYGRAKLEQDADVLAGLRRRPASPASWRGCRISTAPGRVSSGRWA